MKKRNLFMSATIMCALLTISITFGPDQISWLWNGKEPIALVLGVLAVIFGIQWLRYQKLLNKAK